MTQSATPPVSGGTSSLVKLLSNIIISFIGAGVLGLPFAFKETGILGGCFILCLSALISGKSMLMIVDCKYMVAKLDFGTKTLNGLSNNECIKDGNTGQISCDLITFSDIGRKAFGKIGSSVVDLTLVLSQLGFCCAYLIFVAENVTNYTPSLSKWQVILLSAGGVSLLTMIRNLGNLGYFSLLAQCSQTVAFVSVIGFDLQHLLEYPSEIKLVSWQGFPFFFAFSVYCFEGAGMVLALESSSSQQIRHKFRRCLILVMVFITSIYILFGVLGYLSFGDATNAVITLNLSEGHHFTSFAFVIEACLCFALLLTYPVMIFPVSQMLDWRLQIQDSKFKSALMRLCLVFMTVVIVLIFNKFEVLMGFIGATSCSMLGFILPGAFHLKLYGYRTSVIYTLFDIFLVVFGLIVMGFGIVDSIQRIWK